MIFLEIQMSALRGESILLLNLIYSVIRSDYYISLLCSRANPPNSLSICMHLLSSSVQFSHSVMSNSATPWTAAHQASLSITSSRSSLRLTSIESVMPSNHLILCRPLFLPPSIFPRIRVFSNVSVLCIRWPEYWSFSFSISPSNE